MALKKQQNQSNSPRRTSSRRDLLQQLEERKLFAAFTSASFDFRATASGVESGYIADIGKAFSTQGSQQYGWNVNNQANARNRTATGNLSSFQIFGRSGSASTWDLAVPNGTYDVKLVAGDPSAVDSKYAIKVEGTTVVNEAATWSDKYANGSARVQVKDGKLTMTSAAGAWNNKISSIQVTAVGGNTSTGTPTGSSISKPAAPATSGSWAWHNGVGINWKDSSNNETNFIIQGSTDNKTFKQIGKVGANINSFNPGPLKGYTKYYFRIQAINSQGASNWSPVTSVTTGKELNKPTDTWSNPANPVGVPAAPSWTAATGGKNEVKLTWGNVSGELGYIIQRSTNGSSFSEIARVSADVTSYTNYGLGTNTKYYYRVLSYNSAGTHTGTTVNATTTSGVVAAPSKPGWLSAATSSSTSINLVWGDSNTETGFIIERSTNNGSTFTELTRVKQGVTSYTNAGLKASTKYVYRVKAFNAGGTSAATSNASATTSAAPSTGGGTVGTPSTAGINKSAVMGMVPNQISASQAIPMLKALGMKSVRLWYTVGNWSNTTINSWNIDAAKQYKAAGFSIVLSVNNSNVPDYNTAKKQYQALAKSELKNLVDYWEIGNEPNLYEYWRGSLQQFVTNHQKPAYEALHAAGEKVIGTALSWDVKAARQMETYGYSKYCDYTGFHPYGESGAIVAQRAREAKAAFGNKPMIITEWNVQGVSNTAEWAKQITIAAKELSHIAVQNYYYALKVDNTHVGKGGLYYSNGTKNNTFWNAARSWVA